MKRGDARLPLRSWPAGKRAHFTQSMHTTCRVRFDVLRWFSSPAVCTVIDDLQKSRWSFEHKESMWLLVLTREKLYFLSRRPWFLFFFFSVLPYLLNQNRTSRLSDDKRFGCFCQAESLPRVERTKLLLNLPFDFVLPMASFLFASHVSSLMSLSNAASFPFFNFWPRRRSLSPFPLIAFFLCGYWTQSLLVRKQTRIIPGSPLACDRG